MFQLADASAVGEVASIGLIRLRQLPPGLLNTLTAKDVSSASEHPATAHISTADYFRHIHRLVRQFSSLVFFTQTKNVPKCIHDSDVIMYKRILCQWIRGRPAEYSSDYIPEEQAYVFKWPPSAQRYLAMTYIEDHVKTDPEAAWVTVALRAETDFDARETAMWLTDLLRRIHSKARSLNFKFDQGFYDLHTVL